MTGRGETKANMGKRDDRYEATGTLQGMRGEGTQGRGGGGCKQKPARGDANGTSSPGKVMGESSPHALLRKKCGGYSCCLTHTEDP